MLVFHDTMLVHALFSGWLFDITQDYDVPYYVAGGVQIAGGLLVLGMYVIRRRKGHDTDRTINVEQPRKLSNTAVDSTATL